MLHKYKFVSTGFFRISPYVSTTFEGAFLDTCVFISWLYVIKKQV